MFRSAQSSGLKPYTRVKVQGYWDEIAQLPGQIKHTEENIAAHTGVLNQLTEKLRKLVTEEIPKVKNTIEAVQGTH